MQSKVVIILGSKSDLPKVEPALDMLNSLGISFTYRIFSAHRTPKELASFIEKVNDSDNCQVVIAAAGMSAALAGAIAAQTIKPVIGIPIAGSKLDGMDALLSTVQMPPGLPVACMAIDGAKNAALMAAEIVALSDVTVRRELTKFRLSQSKEVIDANSKINRDYKHFYDNPILD